MVGCDRNGRLITPSGIGAERVVADRQPGDNPAGRGKAGGHGHRHVETVGHRRRLIEALAAQVGDQRQVATESRFATRATALLIPEAIPAWRWSAAASTVAVTGVATRVSPSPKTTTPGRTPVT